MATSIDKVPNMSISKTQIARPSPVDWPQGLKDLIARKKDRNWISYMTEKNAKEGISAPPYDPNYRPDLTRATFGSPAIYGPLAPPINQPIEVPNADGRKPHQYELHEFKAEFQVPLNIDGSVFVPNQIPGDIDVIIIMERMESAKGHGALGMACRWESYQELTSSLRSCMPAMMTAELQERNKTLSRGEAVIKTLLLRVILFEIEKDEVFATIVFPKYADFIVETYGELLGRWNLYAEWCDAIKQELAIPHRRKSFLISSATESVSAVRDLILQYHPTEEASLEWGWKLHKSLETAISTTFPPKV